MDRFHFIFFPVGYDFIKTMESTFRYIPNNMSVIVVTPYPEMITKRDYDFELKVFKLDDVRTDWSKENEIINYEKDPEIYRAKNEILNAKGIKFPFALRRNIMPWLVEQKITKFAFVDTDCLINYYGELQSVLDYIERTYKNEQFIFGPIMTETMKMETFIKVTEDVFKKYNISKDIFDENDQNLCFDGYLRGFWYDNPEDVYLFYDLWDSILRKSYEIDCHLLKQNQHTVSDEWLFGLVGYIMNKIRNTKTYNISYNGYSVIKHIYRPENYFYRLPYGLFTSPIENGGYNLKEQKTRKEFIEINKENLILFYERQNGIKRENIPDLIYDFK